MNALDHLPKWNDSQDPSLSIMSQGKRAEASRPKEESQRSHSSTVTVQILWPQAIIGM